MFNDLLAQQFPRIMSQACRDKWSPFYGSFDRNWWHYRIRDFSSIMLQQGGYMALQYSKLEGFEDHREQLRELARASAIFWNHRAGMKGAFEEYYPWEQGYPPLAFSTLAMAKLVAQDVVFADEIETGVRKAANQLQNRLECQAGNQQVAGLAALGIIRKIHPDLVDEEKYLAVKKHTLSLQNAEGWYNEYDGPDLGYLSVTLDCLFDLFDYTGDNDYLQSAEKALNYIFEMVIQRYGGTGMHNARNTDYLVPYGILRFLEHEQEDFRNKANEIIALVFGNLKSKTHFFSAIDDRYWIHYIGHSVARAQLLLNRLKPMKFVKVNRPLEDRFYEKSGYIFSSISEGKARIMISGSKGGIFTLYNEEKLISSDYGWIAREGKNQFVNHWWSDQWKINVGKNKISVSGYLFPHKEKVSKPLLHIGLRLLSRFMGSKVTGILRNVLIFKAKSSDMLFSRKIDLGGNEVIVTDTIEGIGKKFHLLRAPRASKRHVASADSWHPEDFGLSMLEEPNEMIIRKDKRAVITTTYRLS